MKIPVIYRIFVRKIDSLIFCNLEKLSEVFKLIVVILQYLIGVITLLIRLIKIIIVVKLDGAICHSLDTQCLSFIHDIFVLLVVVIIGGFGLFGHINILFGTLKNKQLRTNHGNYLNYLNTTDLHTPTTLLILQ